MPITKTHEKTNDNVNVKKMRSYNNDPLFKEKKETAKAFIDKHGLPKSFSNKR